MKTTFFILVLFLYNCSFENEQMISSKISIIERVDAHSLKLEKGRFYSIKLDLTNNTDSTVNYWTMSCSWQVNWISENKDFRFYIYCPKNVPALEQLKPKETKSYNGIIELVDTSEFDVTKNYKLGFVLIKSNEVIRDIDFYSALDKKITLGKDIYWSEPFRIDK